MPGLTICLLLSLLVWFPPNESLGEPAVSPGEGSEALDQTLSRLLESGGATSSQLEKLVELSQRYLDIATERNITKGKPIELHEKGAAAAERALALDETNAQAHFLYAANLGHAAQLRGVVASALSVLTIKAHTARALELRPDHAPALHMMGRLLDELPWFFGGDADAALAHLERAVEVNPDYPHARLDLAKAYLERGRITDAVRHLDVLVESAGVSSNHSSADRYRDEANRLLNQGTNPAQSP